ncbi:MAG: anaerobic ribonucleoside-triphosphate reductase activating protein [Patescibacteria group bacterium]
MIIGGLQKTTLVDYPSKVACAVFLVGCNFSCPFCHNRDLVTKELFIKSKIKPITQNEFFEFLTKRKGILDGVCISGGEPTLNLELPQFIDKIKALGFLVKLDSNGSHPVILRDLISKKKIDFVAMDIKGPFKDYQKISGRFADIGEVTKSLKILFDSGLPFELRTTVVPTIHNAKSVEQMVKDVLGLADKCGYKKEKIVWFLQNFRPSNCLDPKFNQYSPFTPSQMTEPLTAGRHLLPQMQIRD